MKAQHVIDHIQASYPCTLDSVVKWCINQGLDHEPFGLAMVKVLADGIATLDIEEDIDGNRVLIVNPT
jgi:hypothetical protein